MAYQYAEMSRAEIDEFLDAPRCAIVGTNRRDGAPQLSPVWYLFENGKMYFSIYTGSAKYHNLARDPRISLCVTGDFPDARSVMIYGTANFHDDDGDWAQDIVRRMFGRYSVSDEEVASSAGDTGDEPEGVLVEVSLEKIIAEDYN